MSDSRFRTSSLRHSGVAVLAIACALALACGDPTEEPGRTRITIGPVPDITMIYRNGTSEPLFVDWTGDRLRPTFSHDDQALLIEPGCRPECSATCSCTACPGADPKVKRVDPGEDLVLKWKPVHHIVRRCEQEPSCECTEIWPVTAGTYTTVLSAGRSAVGGSPSPQDPTVLVGATLDTSKGACHATASFALESAKTVTAMLTCAAVP